MVEDSDITTVGGDRDKVQERFFRDWAPIVGLSVGDGCVVFETHDRYER